MPSPVGHSLMGLIIYRVSGRPVLSHRWQVIGLYLFAANAPDLDFIPGLSVGNPNLYHHGVSHSIGFAILFAAVCGLVLFLLKGKGVWRDVAIFFCLYTSHVILDWLSIDTRPPYGVPLIWPLSDAYYIAPIAFLPDIRRVSSSNLDFITSLFSLHNLWAVCAEVLLLCPFILALWLLRKSANSSANRFSPASFIDKRSTRRPF
jgi:inner membrane protein